VDENEVEAQPMEESGGIGARLRAEREKLGLSREEIGDRTKIAERHLDSIEQGLFSRLPGRTYAIGFARSYARALGMDEDEVVSAVRDEMGVAAPLAPPRSLHNLEPGDPARIPSSRLAWGVAALLIALVVIAAVVWRDYFVPSTDLPAIQADEPAAAASPTPAATEQAAEVPSGQVAFKATVEGIWVKFYDRNGRQLFQKQMALGETFAIPADADGPQLWTGRPDALEVTIGGRKVAPLSTEERTIKDVPVDAASLTARPPGPGLPTRTP